MKKVSCCLMILAMAVPAFAAGDIQVTATDNLDGTCTISYVATVAAPVGMGLDIDVTSGGPITAVSGMDAFFDINLDAAYSLETDTPGSYTYGAGTPIALQDAAGETTLAADGSSFALSMGGLGGETAPLAAAPLSGVIAVLAADVTTEGTINLNVKRGGVVDVNGEAMTGNLGAVDALVSLPFTITVGPTECSCEADADLNGFRNPQDVAAVVTYLNINATAPFFTVPSSDPDFDPCMDIDGNSFVNPQDVAAVVTFLNVNTLPPFFTIACPN